MSAYVVAHVTISDRNTYRLYEAGFMEILQQFRGEVCAVDDAGETLEGAPLGTRTVILRFTDKSAALGWYHSKAYQQLAQHRFKSSIADIVVSQGLA